MRIAPLNFDNLAFGFDGRRRVEEEERGVMPSRRQAIEYRCRDNSRFQQ
jgi:hypothetical protein